MRSGRRAETEENASLRASVGELEQDRLNVLVSPPTRADAAAPSARPTSSSPARAPCEPHQPGQRRRQEPLWPWPDRARRRAVSALPRSCVPAPRSASPLLRATPRPCSPCTRARAFFGGAGCRFGRFGRAVASPSRISQPVAVASCETARARGALGPPGRSPQHEGSPPPGRALSRSLDRRATPRPRFAAADRLVLIPTSPVELIPLTGGEAYALSFEQAMSGVEKQIDFPPALSRELVHSPGRNRRPKRADRLRLTRRAGLLRSPRRSVALWDEVFEGKPVQPIDFVVDVHPTSLNASEARAHRDALAFPQVPEAGCRFTES